MRQLDLALLDLAQAILPLCSQDRICNFRGNLLDQSNQRDSFLGRQQLLLSRDDVVPLEQPLDNGRTRCIRSDSRFFLVLHHRLPARILDLLVDRLHRRQQRPLGVTHGRRCLPVLHHTSQVAGILAHTYLRERYRCILVIVLVRWGFRRLGYGLPPPWHQRRLAAHPEFLSLADHFNHRLAVLVIPQELRQIPSANHVEHLPFSRGHGRHVDVRFACGNDRVVSRDLFVVESSATKALIGTIERRLGNRGQRCQFWQRARDNLQRFIRLGHHRTGQIFAIRSRIRCRLVLLV